MMKLKFRLTISFIGVLILHFIIGQQKVLPLRPQSVHQWAQCDRASVAKHFLKNGFDIFHPQVNNLDNGSGITGMEFPFVNFVVAIFYKLFGVHEWIYRLLVLSIFSIGLVALIEVAFYFLQSYWLSFLVGLLFGAMPLFSFYAANFLPDIVSLSFFFISWVYLINYFQNRGVGFQWWTLFFTLAALIKITILIYIPVLFFCLLLDDEFKKHIKKFIYSVSLSTLIVIGWYYYASWLSKSTGSEIFLLQISPLKDFSQFLDVYDEIKLIWITRLFGPYLTLLLYFSPIIFVFIKKINFQLRIIGITVFLVESAFLFLMWNQLRHHDYYTITLSVVFFISLLSIISLLKKYKIHNLILITLVFSGLIWQTGRSILYLKEAYNKEGWIYGNVYTDLYFHIEEDLRIMGINSTDRVITMIDNSPNISLYLINQPGVNLSYRNTQSNLVSYINSGNFKYLLVDPLTSSNKDSSLLSNLPLEFLNEVNSIKVFKINSYQSSKPVSNFNFSPWN